MRRQLIIILLLCLTTASGAITPSPVVSNFNKNDYHHASQNWGVCCDGDGLMYFANGEGLLCFDGAKWELYDFPLGKGIRSLLCKAAKGDIPERLYAGGYKEFGYYQKTCDGSLEYTSLTDKLPADWKMLNDEVWTILDLGEGIFFHSFGACFLYSPEKDSLISHRLETFCESVALGGGGRIYASAGGLSKLNPLTGELTAVQNLPFKGRMVSALSLGGRDLIITLDEGIFTYDGKNFSPFKNEADPWLRECIVNRAASINGDILIGSTSKGCICLSSKGELLWSVEASGELESNTVLGIGGGIDGNVWLALDSGISCINSDNSIRCIRAFSPPIGSIYGTFREGNLLYLGTNHGLYCAPIRGRSLGEIRPVASVKGTVLYLKEFDGQLLCGANEGTYELSGGTVKSKLSPIPGGSCIAEGIIHGKNVLIEGTYSQLCVYQKVGGKWTWSGVIEDFVEPINSIGIDFRGNIWAAHSHEGLYRITLTEDLRHISSATCYDALPENSEKEKISVNTIMGRVIFSNGESSYTYDDMSGKIIPYDALNSSIGRFAGSRTICPAEGDRAWMIIGEEADLVDFSKPEDIRILRAIPYRIFDAHCVDYRQNISVWQDGTTLFAMDNALGLLIPSAATRGSSKKANRLILRRVSVSNLQGENPHRLSLIENCPTLPYSDRLIKVEYSCPRYGSFDDTFYSYRLEGRDKLWSSVGGSEQIELNYLKSGKYTLLLKAFSSVGESLGEVEYSFKIKPPFYASVWAKVIYIIFGLSVCFMIAYTIYSKLRRKQKELEAKTLEDEVKAKSKLIAQNAMSLIRKNEILTEIKNELVSQKQELGSAYPDKYYRKMLSAINSQISTEEDWSIFQKNFDRIHSGFFQTLMERYPELTATDLRFCAYLCLNLSSKEIASMMNISLKGVEAARYRIRRKIGLPSQQSLTEFLLKI